MIVKRIPKIVIDSIIKEINREGKREWGEKFNFELFYEKCRWDSLPENVHEGLNFIIEKYYGNGDFLDRCLNFSAVFYRFDLDFQIIFEDSNLQERFNIKKLYDKYFNETCIKIKFNIKNYLLNNNKKVKNDKKYIIQFLNKVGMEVEFNRERIDKKEIPKYLIDKIFVQKDLENSVIYEWATCPFKYNYKKLMFMFNIVTHYFNNDFNLWEGKYDKYAESDHLHISFFNNNNIINIINEKYPNIFILFIPLFCRNGEFFRDSVYSSCSIIKKLEYIRDDSKAHYITKNSIGTIELRANENTFPYFILFIDYVLKELIVNKNKELEGKIKIIINEIFEKFIYDSLRRKVNIYEIFKYLLPFYNEIINKIREKTKDDFKLKMLDIIEEVFNNEEYHPRINYNIWMKFNKEFEKEIIEFNIKNNIEEMEFIDDIEEYLY